MGELCRIGREGVLTTEAPSYVAASDEGGLWTFGTPCVTLDAVQMRTQVELVKVRRPDYSVLAPEH